MVKKQSASKAPSTHASQKSKGKKDASMTPSLATQKPHFWNMNLLPERGYDMTNATPSFLSTINNLQWDHFVLPRVGYQEEMVREFYAGITESDGPKKTYTSMVRGKIVQFHPKKINEHYMLKYNGFDFERRVGYSSMREMEEVRSRIATPKSVWEKFSSNEIKLRSTYLIDALGNWHLFICTSVLPTSHTYSMTKERLILLDTILSEGNVDIGRLIAREIYTCITKKKGFLFFPCLITELCMKAAVPIYENEHMKFLSNNLRVDMKDRMKKSMPKPVPKPMPKPMPMPKHIPAMQDIFMQKQAAVWKFQNEQHDWLQLIFHHMSNELGNIEAPVFPSWVLRTPGQEEEEEKEESEGEEENEGKEEEAEKEVEEEEEQQLKKRVTRKQAKGKKKVVIEPDFEETYDSEEEDEELEKEMDKESEEEEEEESDVEVDSEEEDRARGVIMEEIARQKYAKTSESTPQETTQPSPTKSPTKTPISSPTKEPSPPLKSPTIQPQMQSPPHSPPPPSKTTTEQPMPQSPSQITATVISDLEKEPMQVREEEGLEEKQESEAVEEPELTAEAEPVQTDAPAPDAPASDAPAPDASASEKTATAEHDEVAIKLVLEEMARKKKEELGNTQKFFKSPALKKQAAKRKVAESTDATASIPASLPASAKEETGAPAPTEETPTKPSKEKKQKVKHTAPTRQSPRTRSGAKK